MSFKTWLVQETNRSLEISQMSRCSCIAGLPSRLKEKKEKKRLLITHNSKPSSVDRYLSLLSKLLVELSGKYSKKSFGFVLSRRSTGGLLGIFVRCLMKQTQRKLLFIWRFQNLLMDLSGIWRILNHLRSFSFKPKATENLTSFYFPNSFKCWEYAFLASTWLLAVYF